MFARSLGLMAHVSRARLCMKIPSPAFAIARPFATTFQDEAIGNSGHYQRRPNYQQRNRFNDNNRRVFNGGGGHNRFNQQSNTLGESLRVPDWADTKLINFKKDFYQPHATTEQRTDEEVAEYRSRMRITVGAGTPKPILNFNELQIPEPIQKQILRKNFASVTPIQAQGWPIALSGQNMVAIAQTGYVADIV